MVNPWLGQDYFCDSATVTSISVGWCGMVWGVYEVYIIPLLNLMLYNRM